MKLMCRGGRTPTGAKAQQILSANLSTLNSTSSSTLVCRGQKNVPFRDRKNPIYPQPMYNSYGTANKADIS